MYKALGSIPETTKGQISRCERLGQVCWRIPLIAASERWRQKDQEFKIILGYLGNCSPGYIRLCLIKWEQNKFPFSWTW